MAKQTSFKRLQIDRANTVMVATIAASAFIVVFSLIAARSLWVKRGFQARLIDEKEVAVHQLEQNLATVDELITAYKAFVETPDNVIGGNPNGSGEKDGDNGKIVLDALPSKYDFPALATSLEKILKSENHSINSITGTDDEVAQNAGQSASSGPVEIPFDASATGTINSADDLLELFERSIRPIHINKVDISGSNSTLQVTVTAKTYYQPEKTLDVKTKVVK